MSDATVTRRSRPRGARSVPVPSSVTQTELIAVIARRLQTCHGMAEFSQLIAEALLELLHPRRVIVSRVDGDRARTLWVTPPVADPSQASLSDQVWTPQTWPALRRLSSPQTWRAWLPEPGETSESAMATSAALLAIGASAVVSVPVVVNGVVWGLITATRLDGRFDDEETALVEVVAALASATLIRLDFDAQVQHMLKEDPLTGLADRRVADNAAEAALDSGVETCIVMCDVDGLKQVNDQLGHGEGDELLRLVADVLRHAAKALPGSVAARIGGDEFCLVVPGWPKRTVEEVMISAVDAHPLPHGAAVSWGLAASSVGEQVTISTLFRSADFAQYRAKRARARRKQLALPQGADPATTAQQLLGRAIPAILAASGELGRVCALAASATDTLGGGSWTVLRESPRQDEPALVVARGGSPAGDEDPTLAVDVRQGGWRIEVGSSMETSQHPHVLTAMRAAMYVAVRDTVLSPVEQH